MSIKNMMNMLRFFKKKSFFVDVKIIEIFQKKEFFCGCKSQIIVLGYRIHGGKTELGSLSNVA